MFSIPIHTFKVLAALHAVPKTIMSYNYVTLNLIKFISLTFLWVLSFTHNVSMLKVRFVNFRLNLSLCPEVIRSLSPHFQVLLYLYTFLTLFEPFLLFLVLDEIYDLSFPSISYLLNLQKRFYSTVHRSCFLTFKYLTRLIVSSASLFLSIPFATLRYFQLVLSLSNDVSENPGPPFTTASDGASPYFSFCNWNLNTLSKDDLSRVSLLDAHNSIHKYDIISLCETSLSKDTRKHPSRLSLSCM